MHYTRTSYPLASKTSYPFNALPSVRTRRTAVPFWSNASRADED